jgi:hypothetical protein
VDRKGAIPRNLKAAHGIDHLFVEDLPDYWRMLYTIVTQHDAGSY